MIIPKIFHRIWLGGEMPQRFVDYGLSWESLHPDWTMVLWGDEDVSRFEHHDLIEAVPEYAAKADIMRLEILSRCGGVYIDTDFECLKNIDSLIKDVQAFCAIESTHKGRNIVCNAILGCVPEHTIFTQAIQKATSNYNISLDIPQRCGPVFFTKLLDIYNLWHLITAFEPKLFYPYLWYEPYDDSDDPSLTFPEAYAIHHWAKSWT